MFIFVIIIALLFLIAFYGMIKFKLSPESKSDHGKQVTLKSAKNSIAVFPIGLLFIELFHRFIQEISFTTYRDFMIALMLITFTIYGFSIMKLKKAN
ncbi:hypothetical protein [Bacillus sp. PS06]|uniref:hypothetical protein n=1 Tax=Bacillus sp. PS06 TaxID=2764176 RepID=UPI00177BD76E|nr:hypothetical protein [Bacillus sp. PS06]MBD8070169.1 hypothetical protein [Bacillus sp. PS06]